jgi:hypothetical protein
MHVQMSSGRRKSRTHKVESRKLLGHSRACRVPAPIALPARRGGASERAGARGFFPFHLLDGFNQMEATQLFKLTHFT